jgi:hypothetical protein
MRQLFSTFILLLITSSYGFGQNNSVDCLSPSFPRSLGALKGYEKKIDEVLLSQLSNFQILQFRHSETIWAIEFDASDENNFKYFLTSVRPSRSIWHSMSDTDGITVYKMSKNISTQDYKLINSLFNSALNTVCASCHNIGIDGTTYNFSNRIISGKVWLGGSPTNETKKERLVLICKEINDLINTKSKTMQLSTDLKNRIMVLTEEFEKQKH